MTTVPGTYFTEEQLETDLKADRVFATGYSGKDRMHCIGREYQYNKGQYDKALAWYILAARENSSEAQNDIGYLYKNGWGVPKNYLCALKWYLKAAKQNESKDAPNSIGVLFEEGQGVPLDKYKALEWYCHSRNEWGINGLERQGYHLSEADKIKSSQQLIKETEAILDAEKKKLEEKQNKTQQKMEALEQLNITYKLTGGDQNAWKDVPILLTGPLADYINEMKEQIQILSQKNSAFNDQDIELQSLKQEKQTMEQDKTNITNEMERLKSSYAILEQLLKSKEDTIVSLNRENQMISTANQGHQQGANEMVDTLKSLLQSKNNEIELSKLTTEHALDKEKGKIKKLLKEIKRLKQTANSRETRPSSSTTVPEATVPSNIAVPEANASNTGTNEDDPNNDFNYDTEFGTEYSSSDDTSSEDGNHANDLNHDSNV